MTPRLLIRRTDSKAETSPDDSPGHARFCPQATSPGYSLGHARFCPQSASRPSTKASAMSINAEADFLFQKSVFLLISSVGKEMAEALIGRALREMGTDPQSLKRADIEPLSVRLEPALTPFVGGDKARRLASALRVLVGGTLGSTADG